MCHNMVMFMEILNCLYQCLFLPFAHAADDRIYAYNLYKQNVSVGTQMAERQKPNSILLRLQRAATRQEVLNSIGLPKYHELQNRKWEAMFALIWHARILFFFFALWWTNECAVAFTKAFFPAGYDALMALDGGLHWLARSIADLFPPYHT